MAWSFLQPLSEHGMLAFEINALTAGLCENLNGETPDRDSGIIIPIVPCNTVRSNRVWISRFLNRAYVKVGEEIKCHLVFSLKRLINSDNIKQLHRLTDMNQLAVVDAQDLKIPQFGNEEFQKLSGQERDAMQLKVLEEISKVVDSKTCSHI